MSLYLVPLTLDEAQGFVRMWHRTHEPAQGHKWSTGVVRDGILCGVSMVGRPVAASFQDGLTLEVTRTATDGTRNANSKLYAAAWRSASGMGYQRLITYTQDQCDRCGRRQREHEERDECEGYVGETGASLRAAGWRVIAERKPRKGWDTPSRPRENRGVDGMPRTLWEAS